MEEKALVLEKMNANRATSGHEEEKTDAEQNPSSQEEGNQPTGRETSLPSSQQEHQPVGESIDNLGQGMESTINFPTKSNIQKIHKDSKNNFQKNKK